MRRKDREITDRKVILEVMRSCEVCHVAFFDEDCPYVVPMNFGMRVSDGTIDLFFHGAAKGKKHDLMRRNNRVGFVMEKTHGIVTGPFVGACECSMEFESVMGTGTLHYVDEAEKTAALQTLLDQYGVSEGPAYHFHDELVPVTTVLRLRVESLSAKKRSVERPKP